MSTAAITEWPTDEGIWMGNIPQIGWFPLQTMFLKGDLPEDKDTYDKPIAVLAQWPESKTSWPYTFKSCHPVKEWRKPDGEELEKANLFYGTTSSC